jgi:hypothetical protein
MEDVKVRLMELRRTGQPLPKLGRPTVQVHRMKTVRPDEIKPYKEEEDVMQKQQNEQNKEIEEGFTDALKRWNRDLIRPQKQILEDHVIQKDVDPDAMIKAMNQMVARNEQISDELAEAHKSFDLDKGEYIADQQIEHFRRTGKPVEVEEEKLEDEEIDRIVSGEYEKSLNHKDVEMKDGVLHTLGAETPDVIRKKEDYTEDPEDEEDSVPIDPSML